VARLKKLVGSRCYLSPVTPEDAEQWAAWLNDLEVALPLGDEAHAMITVADQVRDIDEIAARHQHVFDIVDLATDESLGRCLLFAVNQVDRTAEVGIFLGEKSAWGKGYGREAMTLLLDYAFSLLNLDSVMLGAFAFNERAIRLYERLGFRTIGRRREARTIAGRKHDVVLMDMLAREFESPVVGPTLERVSTDPR